MMQKNVYDPDFYRRQKSGSYRSAEIIVPLLLELMPVRSVCDVGCGVGTWLRCWLENGIEDVLGIDGDYVDRSQLMIPAEKFRSADLRLPVRCDRRFDLVSSLEVAEHIPQERAAGFVADLTALAPVVLFSAAIPGQGGTDHINERWQDHWAGLFNRAGFVTSDVLRPRIWDNDGVEFWYRQNALLFYDPNAVAACAAVLGSTPTMPISLVHPEMLRQKTDPLSTRQSLSALRHALHRAVAHRFGRS
jgi:SAM-dependent methyltransferase